MIGLKRQKTERHGETHTHTQTDNGSLCEGGVGDEMGLTGHSPRSSIGHPPRTHCLPVSESNFTMAGSLSGFSAKLV